MMRRQGTNDLWIDIHPHLFNANDLPVRGFIRNTGKSRHRPLTEVAAFLSQQLARIAPTYESDLANILEVLARPGVTDRRRSAVAAGAPDDPWWARAWRWRKLVGEPLKSRLTLVDRLDEMYAGKDGLDPVDLYVPLAVDLEYGAHQQAPTSPLQQAHLLELISEASLRQKLPTRSVILPMIGFDPHRKPKDERNSLQAVIDHVESGAFIGVKLYPPMGFRPLGNKDLADGAFIDEQLRCLYQWAQDEHVPITAHCSQANATAVAEGFAAPTNWLPVLRDFPGLRLNLAHLGGLDCRAWVDGAARVITTHSPHVYGDVSNHDVVGKVPHFVSHLQEMKNDPDRQGVLSKMMFGSDYWFLHMHRGFREFRKNYSEQLQAVLGTAQYQDFIGGSARSFLGFDQPTNKNRLRVEARMRRLVGDESMWPPALLGVLRGESLLVPQPHDGTASTSSRSS